MNKSGKCQDLAQRLEIVCTEARIAGIVAVTGVSRETIRRYRRGAGVPDAEFLERLCMHLELSAEWVLCGRGQRHRREVAAEHLQSAGLEQLMAAVRHAIAAAKLAGDSAPAPAQVEPPPPHQEKPNGSADGGAIQSSSG